jgi:hypothetical protein
MTKVRIDDVVTLLCPTYGSDHLRCDENVTVNDDEIQVEFELTCQHCEREFMLCVTRRHSQTLLELRGQPS